MATGHSFHTILIGGGAMGAASAWQLARRGRRVLVLDRFHPPHTLGSSHGETRVIREAYFEHPAYVPLVQRAYQLWQELAQQAGQTLLQITGGLMIGPEYGPVFAGARHSAQLHQLPHEILDSCEVTRRFPALRIDDKDRAVFEPRAGLLFVERCITAFLSLAQQHEAVLRFNEPALGWRADGAGVEVTTPGGTYRASHLVLSAGAWLAQLAPVFAPRLQVERQVLHWFQPVADPAWFIPAALPVHVREYGDRQYFYALPDVGAGVKAALHHQGEFTTPAQVRREVTGAEKQAMSALVSRFMPGLAAAPHASVVCLYTNTPDEHFLIDRHPAHENVLVVSPCSGHGFKFASAIGEVVADWLTLGRSPFDLSLFSSRRFG